ncbi:MAG: CRISPR-associated endonuclease Cas2 [Pirellulaceae bacterium]
MAMRHWHLISYDVRDPKRLRRVAKLLEGYGTRLQYSVFRCRLDDLTLEKLHWELNKVMEDEDDLLVMPLCNGCAAKVPLHSTGDQSSWAEKPATFKIV